MSLRFISAIYPVYSPLPRIFVHYITKFNLDGSCLEVICQTRHVTLWKQDQIDKWLLPKISRYKMLSQIVVIMLYQSSTYTRRKSSRFNLGLLFLFKKTGISGAIAKNYQQIKCIIFTRSKINRLKIFRSNTNLHSLHQ